ncbi:uncharacterized protein LOC110108461 [Dendrobium catenatum]|uniref:Uncharacterized protein n=1 Tax=Dendrobium catenatum TaxID=906689 RepID=A0A2I0WJP8_9ASPA|nr:uncharacterized protein LOC110108461 [Dendrobium catenatum]PKU75883.1 hypothetical protein MA16_Dca005930 [Dendrobium catenatum]
MANSKSIAPSLLTKEEENVQHHHHHHLSIFTAAKPSLSPSSSSSSSSTVEDLALSASSKKIGDINGDDEAEGYHTPTSPEHRIRPSVDCPPAPKKPIEGSQRRKRKVSWSIRRECLHLELMSSYMEVDGVWLMKKRLRREEEIN